MQEIILGYTPPGGSLTQLTLNVYSYRGLWGPDELKPYPPIKNDYLDATTETQVQVGIPVVTVDLEMGQFISQVPISGVSDNEIQLFYWAMDNAKTIEGVSVDLEDITKFLNTWEESKQFAKHFILRLTTTNPVTLWPYSPIIPIVDNMIGYPFHDVQVTQDETNPQTFQTGSGAFAVDAGGHTVPPINLSTYAVVILVASKQSALIVRPNTVTQVGGNISFQLGYSLTGNPMPDGTFKCDVGIFLETI